jgi:hypothetical protein
MQRGGTVLPTVSAPADLAASAPEVQSRFKAEVLAPADPPVGPARMSPAPKVERGEGSGSQTTVEDGLRKLPPVKIAGLQNLPPIQVTAPASPEAGTPTTPETPASRKQKRELAKLQSDWPSFQADTSLERKARRRTPTSVSPRREATGDADPVCALSIYGFDSELDEAAELAALDALIATPPAESGDASVSDTTPRGHSDVALDFAQLRALLRRGIPSRTVAR